MGKQCMPASIPLKPRRPTALVVVAILNLIFGGFWLLCGGAGLALNESGAAEWLAKFQKNQPGQIKGLSYGEIMVQVAERVPSFVVVQRIAAIAGLLTSLLLVLSGIGLLRLRAWGRYLGFAYVAVQLPVHIANAVYSMLYVTPVMAKIMDEALAKMPGGFMRQMMEFSLGLSSSAGVVGIAMTLVYPLLVLMLLLLPSVSQAFKKQAAPASGSSAPAVE